MTIDDITALAAQGETAQIEFKRTTGQRTEAAKTVCAMLNSTGGVVLIGVRDDGEIIGQQVTAHTIEEVTHELRRIDPPVFPSIETIPLDATRSILTIQVTSGNQRPYTFDGRAYLRHGPTTQVMPRAVYEQLLTETMHPIRRWENQPVPAGVQLADLDEEEIQRAVTVAVQLGRLEPQRERDIDSLLRGFDLLTDGQLLNAAVVLFGKASHLFSAYPQCLLQVARFRGINRLADFADNRMFTGNLFELLRQAERFLRDNTPIAGRVVPGQLVRDDRPRYAPRATREALANAMCHRDYTIAGGAVSVAMYDDRLEIGNPGTFHFGLTPERLTQAHESRPWNPLIAQVLYRAGIIERWGTGTLNIMDWCRENHAPVPTWEERAGSIVITFRPAMEFELDLGGQTTPVTVQDTIQDTDQDPIRVSAEIARMLPICKAPISRKDLMDLLGLHNLANFRQVYLHPAIEAGLIERTLPEKPQSRHQQYRLTAKGQRWLRKRNPEA